MTLGSLFDGSGTAPLCATLLGWEPLWASEIEPYPVAVTKTRLPKMQHLGSITEINGAEIEPVDVIVGGSPCQDLSVAGKQAGLENGTRSNMFYEMTRIIREMRGATNGKYPRFVVWENVPGAFSSNKGRDFHAVVQAFCAVAEDSVHIPEPEADRKTGRLTWKNAGTVVGDGWSFGWRVLDAQYWGVPQRRRRIFAVLDLGSECAGEILFERAGLPWDSEPRGEAGEGAPADAVGRADRGGGVRCLNPHDTQTQRIYDADGIYPALYANTGGGQNRQAVVYEPMSVKEENWAEADAKNALRAGASKSSHAVVYPVGAVGSLCARADSSPCVDRGQPFVVYESGRGYWMPGFGCLRANGELHPGSPSHCIVYPTVTPPLCARADSSPCVDRGQPFLAMFMGGQGEKARSIGYSEKAAPTLKSAPSGGNTVPSVVYSLQGNGIDRPITAGCNGKGWNDKTMYTLNTIDRPALVYAADCRNGALTEEVSGTLQAKPNGGQSLNCVNPVVYDARGNGDGTIAPTLTGDHQNRVTDYTALCVDSPQRKYVVRRLLPIECCRLQGFPDWWTDGVEGSDSAKYKMWGNGMALPCMLAVLNGINESKKTQQRTCPTCAHYLGGGCCAVNLEAECREGGGYELWEGKNA